MSTYAPFVFQETSAAGERGFYRGRTVNLAGIVMTRLRNETISRDESAANFSRRRDAVIVGRCRMCVPHSTSICKATMKLRRNLVRSRREYFLGLQWLLLLVAVSRAVASIMLN